MRKMKSKLLLKKHIVTALNHCERSVSAQALLYSITDSNSYNQNLVLSTKKIGSACGELVREGLAIKEYKIPNYDYGFYSLTSNWIRWTEEWIKSKIPFKFPEVKVKMEFENKPNILSGKTRIEKRRNKVKVIVTIYISKNLLGKKNIQFAIKSIMVHEFCHIVNPKNPDSVMQKCFPIIFRVWDKTQKAKALECSMEIKKVKK